MTDEVWAHEAKKTDDKYKREPNFPPIRLRHTPDDRGQTSPRTPGNCVHHYVVDPPAGMTSKGICKHCGKEREFRNSIEGGFVGTSI